MKKLHKIDRAKIISQFRKETGIPDICILQDAFPLSLNAHILLFEREFEFTLTHSGKGIKKGTIKELL